MGSRGNWENYEHVKLENGTLVLPNSNINIRFADILYSNVDQQLRNIIDCTFFDKPKRQIKDIKIQFLSEDTAEKLQDVIQSQSQILNRRSKNRVFVFVNPSSGKKKGVEVFQNSVLTRFTKAGITVEHQITDKEGPNSLASIANRLQLDSYDALVIVGGDSSLRDVINSLWNKAGNPEPSKFKLPTFGIIPVGTGNGLAYEWYGGYDIEPAIASIILGKIKKTRVYRITSPNSQEQKQFDMLGIVCLGYGISVDSMKLAQESNATPLAYRMLSSFASAVYRNSETFHMNAELTFSNGTQTVTISKKLREMILGLTDSMVKRSDNPDIDTWATLVLISGECSKMKCLQIFGQFMTKVYSQKETPFPEGESLNGLVNFFGKNLKVIKVDIPEEQNSRQIKNFINVDGNVFPCEASFHIKVFQDVLPCYVGI